MVKQPTARTATLTATSRSTGSPRYPHYLRDVERLVDQHKKLDEPLHLAIYYAPRRHPGDVFLFEIIDRFGDQRVDPDKKLFEFSYGSTPGFPLPNNRSLRLVLTNPREFGFAAKHNWKAIRELRESSRRNAVKVIFYDRLGRKLLELL
jgi:hypothetical protein